MASGPLSGGSSYFALPGSTLQLKERNQKKKLMKPLTLTGKYRFEAFRFGVLELWVWGLKCLRAALHCHIPQGLCRETSLGTVSETGGSFRKEGGYPLLGSFTIRILYNLGCYISVPLCSEPPQVSLRARAHRGAFSPKSSAPRPISLQIRHSGLGFSLGFRV